MPMRHVNMDLVLNFDTPEERWRSEQILLYYLAILTLRNVWFLRENPDTPKLYDSDMVYKLPEQLERRPTQSQLDDLNRFLETRMGMTPAEIQHHLDLARGVEIFRDIPRMMEHGGGDCDNMACMRAAEIIVAAEAIGAKANVSPYLVWREEGDRMIYHAKVKHKYDNSDEDPSLITGMGGRARAADRLEECRKNYERYDNMWQRAKQMMADFDGSESERVAYAESLKAAIDGFGYLPKDGVFRVGRAKAHVVGARPARGLDILGARVGHGGGHGGGHHGGHGGFRQSWGFGAAPTTFVVDEPGYIVNPETVWEVEYDYDVMDAAPEPRALIVPARRAT